MYVASQGLPQFFDWRGELGRLDYFKQIIKRLVILLLILGDNIGLCLLMGLEITAETWDKIYHSQQLQHLHSTLDGSPQVGAYTLLVVIPLFLWGLFILFKPGKTLREVRRQME